MACHTTFKFSSSQKYEKFSEIVCKIRNVRKYILSTLIFWNCIWIFTYLFKKIGGICKSWLMTIKKCVDLQTIELNKYINATPKVFGIVFWVERLIYIKYRGEFQVFFSK